MGVGSKRAEAEQGYHFAFILRGTGGMRENSRVRYQHRNSQIGQDRNGGTSAFWKKEHGA